jgi:hypothetical protein
MPPKDESKQMEDLRKGCVGCLTLVGILGVFIGCSALFFSGKTPEKKEAKTKEINPAASLSIDDSEQIISDEQVGRTMAKVLCGDKTSEEAVDYFNQMGVPVEKMKNIQAFPEVHKGYFQEKGSRNC